MSKIKLATAWFSGCSGCHMSFLDLDERLLSLPEKVEIVYSPMIDVKEFPDGVDVALVEGAVGNAEHLRLLREIRRKTKMVVAFGDCATTGNVPSMRNSIPKAEVLQAVYGTDDPPGLGEGDVPEFLPLALPLCMAVAVDAFLPGCPPDADRIWKFLQAIFGKRPKLSGNDLRFG